MNILEDWIHILYTDTGRSSGKSSGIRSGGISEELEMCQLDTDASV